VNNAMKHAKPSQIQIELTARNGSFTLCVRDDGVGLKAAPQSADGLGLRIMRHRARSMGATFEVRPAPNHGTEICCELSRPSVKPAARGNPPSSL
jgi:signal transduction histidine kinase